MKKAVIAIVVVVILAVGGYLIFHKSSKPASKSTSTSSNAPAVNNAVIVTKTSSSLGQYLADPSGKALYTYNGDKSGVSNCTGSCLATWPAYTDKGSTSNLPSGVSTIKRTDNGQTQYTYNGMPLYYFVSDSSGQVTGSGVENFTVAKPSSSSSSQPSSSTPSNSSAPSNNSTAPSNNNSSPSYSY